MGLGPCEQLAGRWRGPWGWLAGPERDDVGTDVRLRAGTQGALELGSGGMSTPPSPPAGTGPRAVARGCDVSGWGTELLMARCRGAGGA